MDNNKSKSKSVEDYRTAIKLLKMKIIQLEKKNQDLER